MVTKVQGYRLQVLGYRAQVPDQQVAGAGQPACRCRADRLQVPAKQVAGAGQTACRCRTYRLQVLGKQVTGLVHRPRGPGY